MIRVLVDLLFYTGARGGMESYVRELYTHMPSEGYEYVALASAEFAAGDTSWFPGEIVITGVTSANRVAWATAELTTVSRAARQHHIDLIHAPANIGPIAGRVPVVATIHDLLPFRHPEFVPGPYARILRTLIRRTAHHARRLLTVSEASRNDIVRLLRQSKDNVDVIPLAGPPVGGSAVPRARRTLLAVGNRLPHKNVEALIRALAIVPEHERPKLIITGSGRGDPLVPLVHELGLDHSIDLRGWLPAEELEQLYATATATVIPSLFEGFGLPVLEAMSRGCPVLVSDIPVLHEVAGPAALYFDATSPHGIAAVIHSAMEQPERLRELATAGTIRAAEFSWARTAAATAASFRRALG